MAAILHYRRVKPLRNGSLRSVVCCASVPPPRGDKLAKQTNTVRDSTPIASNPFLEVHMKDVRMPAFARASLEVILPGGTKVQVTEEKPMHLLSKVIKALEVTC